MGSVRPKPALLTTLCLCGALALFSFVVPYDTTTAPRPEGGCLLVALTSAGRTVLPGFPLGSGSRHQTIW